MILEGTVTESLPGINFKIKFEEREMICFLGGKMRKNHIQVLLGDRVRVDNIAPDWSIGRIVRRL